MDSHDFFAFTGVFVEAKSGIRVSLLEHKRGRPDLSLVHHVIQLLFLQAFCKGELGSRDNFAFLRTTGEGSIQLQISRINWIQLASDILEPILLRALVQLVGELIRRVKQLSTALILDTDSIDPIHIEVIMLLLSRICIFSDWLIFALFVQHLTVMNRLNVASDADVRHVLGALRGQVEALFGGQIVTVLAEHLIALLLIDFFRRLLFDFRLYFNWLRLVGDHDQRLGWSIHFRHIGLIEIALVPTSLGADQGDSRRIRDFDRLGCYRGHFDSRGLLLLSG